MSFSQFLGRRARVALSALGTAAVLAGCGGGTSQVENFVAASVYAFGDESSTLTADGRKYGVNALDDTGDIACQSEPIWVQTVASIFGHVFAECNPDAVADPKAIMRAAPGARVADLEAQIDAVVAAGGFGERALATVMIGANDVVDLFGEFPGRSEAELVAELQARGQAVAAQVNRLVGLDVRVLISTVFDMGLTPFALAQADPDSAALLSRLSEAINVAIRINIINDGRKLGLVLADDTVKAMVSRPENFGLANATEAACTAALPDCTGETLVDGATSLSWLWADDRHLSYGGQLRLGSTAAARATDNPF